MLCFTSNTLYGQQLNSVLLKQDRAVVSNHFEPCEVTLNRFFFDLFDNKANKTPFVVTVRSINFEI